MINFQILLRNICRRTSFQYALHIAIMMPSKRDIGISCILRILSASSQSEIAHRFIAYISNGLWDHAPMGIDKPSGSYHSFSTLNEKHVVNQFHVEKI